MNAATQEFLEQGQQKFERAIEEQQRLTSEERVYELLRSLDDEEVLAEVLKNPADVAVLNAILARVREMGPQRLEHLDMLGTVGGTLLAGMPEELPSELKRLLTLMMRSNLADLAQVRLATQEDIDRAVRLQKLLDEAMTTKAQS